MLSWTNGEGGKDGKGGKGGKGGKSGKGGKGGKGSKGSKGGKGGEGGKGGTGGGKGGRKANDGGNGGGAPAAATHAGAGGGATVASSTWMQWLGTRVLAMSDEELCQLKATGSSAERCERFLAACATMARPGLLGFLGIGAHHARQQAILREQFATAQLDRQSTGLRSNTAKGSAAHADTVAAQHREALELALHASTDIAGDLHMGTGLILQLHATVCGGNLLNTAGALRKVGVRTGKQHYCPAALVPDEFEKCVHALQRLDARRQCIGAIGFAAAALYGIAQLHPFEDGNGRVARIVANWALSRCGLPFVVNLCATQQQRAEYIAAMRATHSAVDSGVGDNPLQALTRVVANRVALAVGEFERLVAAKAASVSTEAEERAARAARERAAAGSCIICLEDAPNIAALCCGGAVHMKCLAEWLISNETCVQCRAPLPKMPPRPDPPVQPPAARFSDEDTTTMTVSSASDEYSTTTVDQGAAANASDENTTTTTTTLSASDEDSTTTTTVTVDQGAAAQGAAANASDEDTTTTVTSSASDEDTSTTTTSASASSEDSAPSGPEYAANGKRYCTRSECRNIAADECVNGCCGPCCVMHGAYNCARHNN